MRSGAVRSGAVMSCGEKWSCDAWCMFENRFPLERLLTEVKSYKHVVIVDL